MTTLLQQEWVLHPKLAVLGIDFALRFNKTPAIQWLCHDSPPQAGSSVRLFAIKAEESRRRIQVQPASQRRGHDDDDALPVWRPIRPVAEDRSDQSLKTDQTSL
jgi:hypothetical protein